MAIEIQPAFTNQYFSLVMARARLGDKAKADQALKTFRELKARDEQSHRQAPQTPDDLTEARQSAAEIGVGAGQVRISLGDVAGGEQLLRRAGELCPEDTESRMLLAGLCGRHGRDDEAARVLDDATRIAADQPTVPCRA